MFEAGCLHSAVWHRFSATLHSPIVSKPEDFGIRLDPGSGSTFDRYTVAFRDPTATDHDRLGPGLEHAVNCFREGVGLDADLASWFDHPVPPTTVDPDFIARAVADLAPADASALGSGWTPAAKPDASTGDTAAVEIGDGIWSNMDGGFTLLMNVENGRIVALNASATSMWNLLCRGWSRRSIVASLVQDYDADAADLQRDLDALVRSLSAKQFVRTKG